MFVLRRFEIVAKAHILHQLQCVEVGSLASRWSDGEKLFKSPSLYVVALRHDLEEFSLITPHHSTLHLYKGNTSKSTEERRSTSACVYRNIAISVV